MYSDRIINSDILSNQYAPRKKEWIQLATAAAGLASTIFGGIKSSQKEKEAERKEAAAHAANMAYYNRKYNESYADTAAGQNTIRIAKDYANQNWKKAQGAAAVGGGTDAATAQAKEAGNKMVGNAVANIAANDTARKDRAGDQMAAENTRYATQQAGQLRQQGANIANTASATGNAMMAAGQVLDGGAQNVKRVDTAKQMGTEFQQGVAGQANQEIKNATQKATSDFDTNQQASLTSASKNVATDMHNDLMQQNSTPMIDKLKKDKNGNWVY